MNNRFNNELEDQIRNIFVWAKEGLLKYVNKEKASAFVNQLRSQFPQKWHGDVEAYMDNIVNNLEESKGNGEKK